MNAAAGGYEVIVIGGGHNGLISAALFARAGARTVLLEKRDRVGGCTETSAPWPEHPDLKVSTYSYVCGLLPRRIIDELQLQRYGFRVLPYGPYFQAFNDGRCLVLSDDPTVTRASIAQFSARDAEAYGRFEGWLDSMAEVIWPLFTQVPPRLGSLHPVELLGTMKIAWQARGLGVRGVADLTRLFTSSINDLLDEWFESDELKGSLAHTAALGAWAGPGEAGTAYVLLHLSMGDPGDGHVGGWGFVRGGTGGLAAACRAAAQAYGAEIRTGVEASAILTRGDRATGVALASGEELYAPTVVSAVHPKLAFLELLDPAQLPPDFVADIRRFKCRGGGVKINLALAELPDFTATPGKTLMEHHTGGIELAPSPAYVQTALDDARAGRAAAGPICDGMIPSSLDDSLMPPGRHFMSLYSQWVPHEWVDEPHREELEAYADRLIDAYDELAPNLKRSIIARQVIGPYDLQNDLGLIGGNVYGGELSVDQMFHMRPAAGYADYRTPLRGLYNGSAGAHGGGGISGIPGWQAFRQAMKDRGDVHRPPWRAALRRYAR